MMTFDGHYVVIKKRNGHSCHNDRQAKSKSKWSLILYAFLSIGVCEILHLIYK